MTDEGVWYTHIGKDFERHETVKHRDDEYVRYVRDPETGEAYAIHTNTAEGYFSLFKRGMKASINIAAKSIYTAISLNLTSATTTVPHLAARMENVRRAP